MKRNEILYYFGYYAKLFTDTFVFQKVNVNEYPLSISVEASSACNLSCEYCYQKDWEKQIKREKGSLSLKLFKELLEYLSKLPKKIDINFDMGGEPFLNPNIIDMINCVPSYRGNISITTNGALMSKELIDLILNSRLYKINFSIDVINGINIRHGFDMENVIYFIETIIRERKKLKKCRPIVAVRSVGWDGVSKAYVRKLFKEKPDSIFLSPPTNWAGLIKKPELRNGHHICLFPWVQMAMLYTGEFVVCCNDPRGEYIVGKFPEDSIEKIWTGNKLYEIRRIIINKNQKFLNGQYCGCCSVLRNGIPLKYYINLMFDKLNNIKTVNNRRLKSITLEEKYK